MRVKPEEKGPTSAYLVIKKGHAVGRPDQGQVAVVCVHVRVLRDLSAKTPGARHVALRVVAAVVPQVWGHLRPVEQASDVGRQRKMVKVFRRQGAAGLRVRHVAWGMALRAPGTVRVPLRVRLLQVHSVIKCHAVVGTNFYTLHRLRLILPQSLLDRVERGHVGLLRQKGGHHAPHGPGCRVGDLVRGHPVQEDKGDLGSGQLSPSNFPSHVLQQLCPWVV